MSVLMAVNKSVKTMLAEQNKHFNNYNRKKNSKHKFCEETVLFTLC